MSIRSNIQSLRNAMSPVLRRLLQSGEYGWKGDYTSWDEALKDSRGYDQESILKKVSEATQQVQEGKAIYERDSVLFDRIEYSWPLLAAIMWVAARKQGNLSVLDFGGSLGSSYFQNRKFLKGLPSVLWSIVEQEHFVKEGASKFSDASLRFFSTIDEVFQKRGKPNVLLTSCTLPYLNEPYKFLQEMIDHEIEFLLVDNTPFNRQPGDRLTVQTIPPSIYAGSYPCWFLDYNKVIKTVEKRYSIVEEYNNDLSIYLDGHKIPYRGFLARIK